MIFSLRQLQDNCREQQQQLFFLVFVDLTKWWRNDGATSEALPVSGEVKLGCVLALTLFGIFLSMLLQYPFADCSKGVYIWMRADSKLFKIARLCAKTKTLRCCSHMMLPWHLTVMQAINAWLISCLTPAKSSASSSSKEDKHPCSRCSDTSRHYHRHNTELKVVDSFTYMYPGSTVSSKASLDIEISLRIAKATTVMAKQQERVKRRPVERRSTNLVSFPHSFTVVSHGPLMPDGRSGSTGSTSSAFCVSFRSNSKTESPKPRSLNVPTCLASLHYSSKDAYSGSVMYTIWHLITCQGKSSTGNCRRASDVRADHSFASRMFASATCNSLISVPTPGRSLP